MTQAPLIIIGDGKTLGRDRVQEAARALLEELDLGPVRPSLMPLCSRYGDFMTVIAAGRDGGLPIILPNDADAAAVNRVIAEAGDVVVLASRGDDVAGISGAREIVIVPHGPADGDAASIATDGASGGGISLFTSGTTGRPVRHSHSFAMLEAGAREWIKIIGAPGEAKSLVCTVPPQHMYGLEAGIMLPLCSKDVSVFDARPFFAANVADALNAVPAHRVLVTTPMHLDLLVRGNVDLPPLHAVITATTALDADLAREAERRFATRVVEVFGTTETGLIGTREPTRTDVFMPRDDLRISFDGRRMSVASQWRTDALKIDDTIEQAGKGFRHIGRGDDLVNVAGKRGSLAGLTRALCEVDGVMDGAFVMPDRPASGRGQTRPVAFAVAPGLDADTVRRALRKRIVAAFVPKRVVMIDEMPRTPSGKPHVAGLLAMLAETSGAFSVPGDHPSLPGHFPGNPIVPGAVVLDLALRTLRIPPSAELKSVKFTGVLRPEEGCIVEASTNHGTMEITCRAGDRPIMQASVWPDPS